LIITSVGVGHTLYSDHNLLATNTNQLLTTIIKLTQCY